MIIPQGKIANILRNRIEISKITLNNMIIKKENKEKINEIE
jgi:hypothetical protein